MKQIILIGAIFFFFISLVSASTFPHAFYGTVAYSDGTLIQEAWIMIAKINGEEVGRSDIINGKYDLITESAEGGPIDFYISGKSEIIKSYIFEAFEITELNLVTNIPNPNADSNSGRDDHSSDNGGSDDTPSGSSSSNSTIILNKITDTQTTNEKNTIGLNGNQETTNQKITGGVIGFIKSGGGLIVLIFSVLIIVIGIGVIVIQKKHKTSKNDE